MLGLVGWLLAPTPETAEHPHFSGEMETELQWRGSRLGKQSTPISVGKLE